MDDLSDKDIIDIIKETLEYGYVIPSKHARSQMSSRSYSMADVKNILKNGKITKKELNDDHRCYTFMGNDLEGHPGGVVIELNISSRKMVIITVKGGVK
ncbi:MAG: hypothetical protein CVU55_03695 [Deltaproteobacteria bacterium HGW-Deltaproteobacteria-13]|jgi:hypothetical protein|nr:MAG: hypothetical protein CVU55_03695 [Deltaproteobacteria bacterium HGW-Deltaproteobacteria-13]